MELIATARFKKAMDRATAATAYTQRITQLVADLANAAWRSAIRCSKRATSNERAMLLVLTANRGLCGGYNGTVLRAAIARYDELKQADAAIWTLEISGKRGIAACQVPQDCIWPSAYTQFEDKPQFDEVEALANRYLEAYVTGKLDRLDVAYTKFDHRAATVAVVETLLPLGHRWKAPTPAKKASRRPASRCTSSCRRPRAFWKRSCRPASRSSCSSASSTRPSASRSPAWSR